MKEERQPMWQLLLQGGGAGAEGMTPQRPGALQIFSFESKASKKLINATNPRELTEIFQFYRERNTASFLSGMGPTRAF